MTRQRSVSALWAQWMERHTAIIYGSVLGETLSIKPDLQSKHAFPFEKELRCFGPKMSTQWFVTFATFVSLIMTSPNAYSALCCWRSWGKRCSITFWSIQIRQPSSLMCQTDQKDLAVRKRLIGQRKCEKVLPKRCYRAKQVLGGAWSIRISRSYYHALSSY